MKNLNSIVLLIATVGLALAACNSLNGINDFTFDGETKGVGGAVMTSGTGMACDSSTKDCFGVCVSIDDPAFGCATPSCEPCPSAGGASAPSCKGGLCADELCQYPFDNCYPEIPGCETAVDGSDPMHCGGCFLSCPVNATCCSGMPICVDTNGDVNNCGGCGKICQGANTWCSKGICGCKPGFTLASGNCVDLKTDPKNCGMPGSACGGAQVCDNGLCKAACGAGLTNCSGSCVDTKTHPLHCGGCNSMVCGGNQVCLSSLCRDFVFASVFGCNACPCDSCATLGLPTCSSYPGTATPICF